MANEAVGCHVSAAKAEGKEMSTDAMRMEYNRRKSSGLCIVCPKRDIKPVKTGTLMCEEHLEYHRQKCLQAWRAKKSTTKTCAQCPKTFVAPSSNKTQRFCSRKCSSEWHKSQRPPKVIPKASFESVMKSVCYENYPDLEGRFAP